MIKRLPLTAVILRLLCLLLDLNLVDSLTRSPDECFTSLSALACIQSDRASDDWLASEPTSADDVYWTYYFRFINVHCLYFIHHHPCTAGFFDTISSTIDQSIVSYMAHIIISLVVKYWP